MSKDTISFKHSGTSGDLIYWLACIRQAWIRYGKKAVIYQWLDRPGYFYDGAHHPYNGVMMNQYAFDMLKPLLLSQEYVADFRPWVGEPFMIDMDKVRVMKPLMPYGNIIKWLGYCYGDIMPNVAEKWIKSVTQKGYNLTNPEIFPEIDLSKKILINRTSRYQNQWINYFFLKKYQGDIVFIGLENEWDTFCKQWELNVPLLSVDNFLELAVAIRSSRFFIGNQSMCFAMAEAMKHPRILEVCPFAPNVDPVGEHAYDFLYQEYFENYVEQLYHETV